MATPTPAKLFGKILHRHRCESKLSTKQLAKEAGCSQSAISRWENGQRCPSLDQMVKLSHCLGCRTWKLVREIERELP